MRDGDPVCGAQKPITIWGRSPRWSRKYPKALDGNRSDGLADPSKYVEVRS